jgi:hypothetical protein
MCVGLELPPGRDLLEEVEDATDELGLGVEVRIRGRVAAGVGLLGLGLQLHGEQTSSKE